MDKRIVNLMQQKLESLASETASRLREKNRADILIERSAESCEQETLAVQRDLAVETLGLASLRLREIEAALRRIYVGAYGLCAECDTAISEPRLRAVPWARHCLSCQQQLDQVRERNSFRPLQFAA